MIEDFYTMQLCFALTNGNHTHKVQIHGENQ